MARNSDVITVKIGADQRALKRMQAIEKSYRRELAALKGVESALKGVPPDYIWLMEQLQAQEAQFQKQYYDLGAHMLDSLDASLRAAVDTLGPASLMQKAAIDSDLLLTSAVLPALEFKLSQVEAIEAKMSAICDSASLIDEASISAIMDSSKAAFAAEDYFGAVYDMSAAHSAVIADFANPERSPAISTDFLEKPSTLLGLSVMGIRSLEQEMEFSNAEMGRLRKGESETDECRSILYQIHPELKREFDSGMKVLLEEEIDGISKAALHFRRIIDHVLSSRINKNNFKAWERPNRERLRKTRMSKQQRKVEYITSNVDTQSLGAFAAAIVSTLSSYYKLLDRLVHLPVGRPVTENQVLLLKAWTPEALVAFINVLQEMHGSD